MNYRQHILSLLHATPLSRVRLAEKLTITRAYVTKLTARLMQEGLIEETTQLPSLGRPGTLLAVVAGRCYSVNVMVRQLTLVATLNDFSTRVPGYATFTRTFSQPISPQAFCTALDDAIAQLCRISGVARDRILHTGIALQGGIEQHSGVVRWCPLLDSGPVALREPAQQACGTTVSVVNIAWCSCYMLSQQETFGRSWLALLPGLGSLGFGYFLDGRPALGDRGFYPEIVHLPFAGGIEQAFRFQPDAAQESGEKAVAALVFAISCIAPLHNIQDVVLSGEFFEEAPDWIIPRTRLLLAQHPTRQLNTLRLHAVNAVQNQSHQGLVMLSADAIAFAQ